MKEKYKKIIHKKEFCKMLSGKLQIECETIRNYFETGRVPKKHYVKLSNALDIQLKLDEKINEMTETAFKKV